MKLFEHQLSDAARLATILAKRRAAANMGETGEGKTGTACAVAEKLEVRFVVVCPKSTISHWNRWVESCALASLCVGVFGWEALKLGCHPEIYSRARGGWQFAQGVELLVIFDEGHRGKSRKSLNAKLMADARARGLMILAMSGTLIQSVVDLGGLAYPLGLVERPEYWRPFAVQFGLGIDRKWGGYIDKSTKLQRHALHELLAKISTRTKRSDIALESAITRADLLDMADAALVRAAYEDLAQKLSQIAKLEQNAASGLTERLRGRQKIELLKIPDYCEQAKAHLEEGCKVVLMLNFTDSVGAAVGLLPLARVLTGETSTKDREKVLEDFNFGNLDVLVGNIGCMSEGISLHDQDGKKPRVALISPPESATVLQQALGRVGGRLGSKSVGLNRILFCAGTVEEAVYDNVQAKIAKIEDLNDGDLQP